MNNPFAPSPQSVQQATANRFPDISHELAQSPPPPPPPQAQPQYGYQQPVYHQQQQPSYLQATPTGYQPQSPFGQQLVQPQQTGHPSHSPQPPSGSYSPYPQQQQTPQVSFSLNDLDPYANLGSLHQQQVNQGGYGAGAGGAGGGAGGGQPLPSALSSSQQRNEHPRQYVQANKAGLMAWEEYSWKQLLSRVDDLRLGWEARKTAIVQVGQVGADPSSVERLRKEADSYIDSIHAAKLQLSEVQEGWRHSTDPASKARVREALNAGLSSLPEYPPALSPDQLGGTYAQRAYHDQTKSHIMSGFQQPQQTGYGQQQMQPQQTGYYPQQQQQQFGGGGMQPQQTGWGGGAQQQFGGAAPQGGYGQQQGQYGQQQGYGQGQYYG